MEGLEAEPQLAPPAGEARAADATGLPGRDFPARAEALRRAGEPDAALRLARQGLAHDPSRLEGHVAEALALLDLHQPEVARRSLERALEASGCAPPRPAFETGFEAFGDAELESAFAAASPERDSMIDADDIALQAMRAERLDEPESVGAPGRRAPSPSFEPRDESAPSDPLAADSPFQTRTMAELLERQGDSEAARAIRTQLEHRSAETDTRERRAAAIARLERWLTRLRGGDA